MPAFSQGWPRHLDLAVDAAPDAAAAAEAAIVLAHALSRAQRFEAVDVIDRASSSLEPGHPELELRLMAASVVPGINDPATAPTAGLRGQALRTRAACDSAAPPEVLAAAAFTSVRRTSRPRSAPTWRTAQSQLEALG